MGSTLDAAIIGDIRKVGVQTGQNLLSEMISYYCAFSLEQFGVIREVIAAGDAVEAAKAAHTLRSASATLGVAVVAETCAEMERKARDGRMTEAAALVPAVAAALGAAHQELQELLLSRNT